jgi:hypothetical protein
MLTDQPGLATWIVQFNRAFGSVIIWTIAILARRLILQRARVEREEWVRSTEADELAAMQGERSLAEIGGSGLDVLATALDTPVAAIYASEGTE